VLFRLYRTVKSCERAGQPHRKKTQLARDLLDVLATWAGDQRVELAADSAYCNDTITRGLPANFVLFGAMRPDAVLTALPPARRRKQLLGFGDSSARKRAAVERTAPFVGFVYTTLVLWFSEGVHRTRIAAPPLRPWYRHKQGLCFADVLRPAQRALAPLDVLDPRRSLGNLRKPGTRRAWPHEPGLRHAA